MNKVTKFLMMAAIVFGFAACNNEEVSTTPETGGNTYMGVRLAFPGGVKTRALSEDYNLNGEWKGRDDINTITVYVVNESKGTVDFTTFKEGQFEGIDANGYLKPTLAVKATAGENIKAYAVVNDFSNKTASLQTVGAAQFDAQFKELEVTATAAEVAKFEGGKEIVMMTNDTQAAAITIAPNVTEQQAKDGQNLADISVTRVASRGIVTIGTGVQATPIEVKDANKNVTSTISLKSITYAVGQSNKKFFNMHKTDWATPAPVYGYVPANGDWATSSTNFDYSDLATAKDLQAIADKSNQNVVTALAAEQFSKFVLPVTHADADYRKGNTTYFEIACTFAPSALITDAAGTETNPTDPVTVFLGMNDGKFYASRELAEANGQKATEYTDGVMKYVLWLNPDKPYNGTEKITMSPTVRNQVYHAHITGFKEIGVPNNPLNPEDPEYPDNPDNPIDPEDPLQTEDTYMSVSITVLPWAIHSYNVNLDGGIY